MLDSMLLDSLPFSLRLYTASFSTQNCDDPLHFQKKDTLKGEKVKEKSRIIDWQCLQLRNKFD